MIHPLRIFFAGKRSCRPKLMLLSSPTSKKNSKSQSSSQTCEGKKYIAYIFARFKKTDQAMVNRFMILEETKDGNFSWQTFCSLSTLILLAWTSLCQTCSSSPSGICPGWSSSAIAFSSDCNPVWDSFNVVSPSAWTSVAAFRVFWPLQVEKGKHG